MADGKLKIDLRRNRILELLRQDGKVLVSQLSRELDITPVTVRNDLAVLEQRGHLVRMQGGAVLPHQSGRRSLAGLPADVSCPEEKQQIGEAAAGMIRDGDTLFINAGTTTQFVAAALKKRQNLNVVTNSLAVALELGTIPTFRVLLLGGEVNARYSFTTGGDAQTQLQRYQADWAILAVDGVSVQGGITTYHADEAAIDRMMIQRANRTVVAADHTKIGRAGFTRICEADEKLCLVTDDGVEPSVLRELENVGVKIVIGRRESMY